MHTTINEDVEFFDNDGRAITFDYTNAAGEVVTVEGGVALREAFFNPALVRQAGIDGILKYSASSVAEEVDTQIVDSLRNFLFGLPGQGGLDLASLNIERGREHGLADYNATREALGLERAETFAEITSDEEFQQALEQLYGDVDNIDLWVGVIAEDHVRGSSMGELGQAILVDQFERLRDGDRLWYLQRYQGRDLARLEKTTLADIIERNTGVEGLQSNVFFLKSEVSGQVFADANGNGVRERRELGVSQVTVQLLDEAGEVIASTVTDRKGSYRFREFVETGDYHVQIAAPEGILSTTSAVLEVLVSTGDARVRGVDFGLQLSSPPSSSGGGRSRVGAEGERSWAQAVEELFGTEENLSLDG